jgi:hypothetical protein
MNEWQVLMAMEARYERGRCRHRPAWRRFWKRWTSFGMRLFVALGRSEMGSLTNCWHEELAGLNAQARELEATIAANVVGILEM